VAKNLKRADYDFREVEIEEAIEISIASYSLWLVVSSS
tara:strand:- start:28730 stop:28843 length:114 start_codon:yes stop_codon:yes gene_type:complete